MSRQTQSVDWDWPLQRRRVDGVLVERWNVVTVYQKDECQQSAARMVLVCILMGA